MARTLGGWQGQAHFVSMVNAPSKRERLKSESRHRHDRTIEERTTTGWHQSSRNCWRWRIPSPRPLRRSGSRKRFPAPAGRLNRPLPLTCECSRPLPPVLPAGDFSIPQRLLPMCSSHHNFSPPDDCGNSPNDIDRTGASAPQNAAKSIVPAAPLPLT